MAPRPITLPCALAFPPPSHKDATTPSPCWAPYFRQKNASCSRIPPERAGPLSHRDERRHAVSSHSALALRLYLAACNPFSSCCFWVLDHLCHNLSQSFHFCWIMETRSFHLCVRFYISLFCLCFSDRIEIQLQIPVCNLVVINTAIPLLLLPRYSFLAVSEILSNSDTCAVSAVQNAVGLFLLLKTLPRIHLFSAADDKEIVSYVHIHLTSQVLHRRRRFSPRRPMYLLIVGSDYCVMRFAYALHVRRLNLVPLSCLYTEPFRLVIEIIFHYCTTPPCHNINLFKRPFRGSRFERLDVAFVLLISLISRYPQKILMSVRWPFDL